MTPSYLLLFSGEAKKIGLRSTGHIRFQILTDADRQHLWLRLSGNDSSGCFSTELVDFAAIEAAVQNVQNGQPIVSKALAPCFRGRSSNNGPFAVSALRSLGLLKPDEMSTHLSHMADDWPAWRKTMLAAEGAEFTMPVKEKPVAGEAKPIAANPSPEHTEHKKTEQKGNRRGKPVTGGGDHADHSQNV